MQKSDLQNRMVVEFESGDRGMVVGDIILEGDCNTHLNYYTDDLKLRGVDESIVRIYEKVGSLEDIYSDKLRPLWKRPFPISGERAFVANTKAEMLCNEIVYDSDTPEHRDYNRRGLLFKTEADAVRMAHQMICVTGGEV